MKQLKLKKRKLKFRLTDRKKQLITGLVISALLITSPILFYLYRFAPADTDIWETKWFVLGSGGFSSVQIFIHQLFTKITFVIITSIWYLTCKHWWKHAILVPLTMFLFQLSGTINYSLLYIDEYEFFDSLPIIIPLIALHIYFSKRLNRLTKIADLKDEIEFELKNL